VRRGGPRRRLWFLRGSAEISKPIAFDTLTEALAAVREREAARVNLKCSVMIAKSGTLVNPISVRAVVHYDNDNDCLTLQIELPNDHGIALSVGDDDAPAVRFWHGNGKSALGRLSLKALREWLKTALGQVQVRARTAQIKKGARE